MARRLTRNPNNSVLGGVASGFADYFDVDPVLVRLVFILLAFLNGLGVLFYVVCWVVMPRREPAPPASPATPPPVAERIVEGLREGGESASQALRTPGDPGRGRIVAGVVLIFIGAVLLLQRFSWLHWPHWARLANLWPLALIAIGVALLLGAARSEP